ncbi:MAG: DUF2470 domain-containing protein [Hyphomicrobiaceae bacterium]|nr:DUF2470 domain-containing protein [Hyphomicrobiaceae bacterium]
MTERAISDGLAPAVEARISMRARPTAALGTLAADGRRTPYVSLVAVAFAADGSPLMLLSKLALHTRNLLADARASLLFDATGGTADPISGARLTVMGRVGKVAAEAASPRFLARHPGAAQYAGFSDFGFYRFDVDEAHFIGGFGKIVPMPGHALGVDTTAAGELLAAEAEIVAHMNDEHADAVALYAERIAGHGPQDGPWRFTAIDPMGFDIAGRTVGCRIEFRERVLSPQDARRAFRALAEEARGRAGP